MNQLIVKSKKLFVLLLAAIFCIGLFGCSNSNNNSSASSENIKIMRAEASMAHHYDSLSDLNKDATEIIEGKVLDTNTIVYEDTPFTISNVQILSTKKGEEKAGNKIKVIETGGIYSLTGKNSKEKKGEKVDFQLDGIPVMKPNEHVYLFLKKFVGPQVTGAYVIIGGYQGTFKFDNKNNVVQQAPAETKMKKLDNLNKDNFEKKLNQAMAK